MSTRDFLLSSWGWDLSMAPACALVLAATWAAWRAHHREGAPTGWRWGFWAAGVAVFLLALVSPIGFLAKHYLFSAHMLQHLLLLLVVPALALLGWPAAGAASAPGLRHSDAPGPSRPLLNNASLLATHPALTWLAGVGAMWLWHAPTLCNAATTSPGVRALQTVSLLALGTLFWWPMIGPQAGRHLAPLVAVFYLFTACLACTLLGILITFTPLTVCSVYTHPSDPAGALPLIRQQWGFTPPVDQQVGGLIMWVPACLIYLSAIMALLLRWFAGNDTTPQAQPLPNMSREAAPGTQTAAPDGARAKLQQRHV